jgi:hypothetical protein
MSIRTIPRPYAYKAAPITPADKERLILDYAPTIKYIAQRVAAWLPPHIALEDLINMSLDEEQVHLMRFQQAFATAAHLLRVAQALSDEVVCLIR